MRLTGTKDWYNEPTPLLVVVLVVIKIIKVVARYMYLQGDNPKRDCDRHLVLLSRRSPGVLKRVRGKGDGADLIGGEPLPQLTLLLIRPLIHLSRRGE